MLSQIIIFFSVFSYYNFLSKNKNYLMTFSIETVQFDFIQSNLLSIVVVFDICLNRYRRATQLDFMQEADILQENLCVLIGTFTCQ